MGRDSERDAFVRSFVVMTNFGAGAAVRESAYINAITSHMPL